MSKSRYNVRQELLETLEQRRKNTIRKFAGKTSQNPQYAHWFPENQNRTSQRNPKKYEEQFARSKRLYCSPVYYMRRVLNETQEEPPEEITDTLEDHSLNDPFTL